MAGVVVRGTGICWSRKPQKSFSSHIRAHAKGWSMLTLTLSQNGAMSPFSKQRAGVAICGSDYVTVAGAWENPMEPVCANRRNAADDEPGLGHGEKSSACCA